MAWTYLAASVDSASPWLRGSSQLPTVKSTDIATACCFHGWQTGHYPSPPFGTILEPLGWIRWAAPGASTSFMADSPARTSVLQAMEQAWQASEADYFSRYCGSSAKSSRRSSSLKMSRPLGPVAANEWGKNWPASGMIVDGACYPLSTWERRTKETAGSFWPTATVCGNHNRKGLSATSGDGLATFVEKFPTATPYGHQKGLGDTQRPRPSLESMARHNLWPTPRASDGEKGGPNQRSSRVDLALPAAVVQWHTPNARDHKDCGENTDYGSDRMTRKLAGRVGGSLNPTWVEWLMGYPSEWTVCADWAMPSSRSKPAKPSAA